MLRHKTLWCTPTIWFANWLPSMSNVNIYSKLSFEYSLCGMLFFDLTVMKILFVNSQATAWLSEDPQSVLVGRSITDFMPPNLDNEILKKEDYYGELSLVRENGNEFPVLATIKTITQDGLSFGFMSFQDISAQKKVLRDLTSKHEGIREILQELTDKNEELLRLDKAKDKFLSLVTHELRTPLNTIVATSEIIYKRMYDTEAEHGELSKNLYLQSNHMLELVNDILDMTKIHSGKMEFYVEQGDPCETIEDQANFFLDMARNNNVEIVFEKPEAPTLCYYDGMRLKQVAANLISNAIKFNKSGGKVSIKLFNRAEFVEIAVADEGIGIPKEKFESIFNEFETIESISNHHKGTGLGLSIVRSLVKGLGGDIRLESVVGKGTTFFVLLPKEKVLDESVYRSRQSDGIFFFDDDSST